MHQFIEVTNAALPVLYGILFAAYLSAFLGKGEVWVRRVTSFLPFLVVLHGAYLAGRTIHLGHIPLLSRSEAMSTVGFCLAVIYLIQERQVRVREVGVFVLGPAWALQLFSSFHIQHIVLTQDPQFQGALFRFHVFTSILAYVGFAVAAFYGVLFLLLLREIESRRLGFMFSRLPALETLSRMNYRTVLLAFVLFTLGVITGTVWAIRVLEDHSAVDPKMIGSVVIWLIYASFLGLSALRRWQGRSGALLSLFGFAAVLTVFVALNFLLPSFHDFL